MNEHTTAPTALLTALALVEEHGSAADALRVTGLDLDALERFNGLPAEFAGLFTGNLSRAALNEAVALGFLAGRVADRPRPRRRLDPTSFLLDRDLLIRAAEGESVLRLPWCEEEMFVGRVLPDVAEIPAPIRSMAIEHDRAALAGQRGRFEFTSYGHHYIVDAVAVRNGEEQIIAVLAIARPAPPPTERLRAAMLYERIAEALDDTARLAEHYAEVAHGAGDGPIESRQREVAEQTRHEARQARARAFRLRSNGPHVAE